MSGNWLPGDSNRRVIWKTRCRSLDLTHRGMLMGVLNVTPDSFSDGGKYEDPTVAVEHALSLAAEGADIIDVGGESTRPGAGPVDEQDEMRRIVPVIRGIRSRSDVLISIDTTKALVAAAAVREGADIINDITALRGDPDMAQVAHKSQAGVVLMHMQGRPRTMQVAPTYTDVVAEVGDFFRQRIESALNSGIDPMSIALDPGIGFGKSPAHNRDLLAAMGEFTGLQMPLLVGVSRKSFLGWIAKSKRMEDRYWPGIALTSYCRERGARIFRVHEPRPHREALRMTEAILGHA